MGISLTYNGVSSSSFLASGRNFLHIMTKPSIPGAVEDREEKRIPGRDGALVTRDGTYAPIEIPVTFSFRLAPSEWDYLDQVYSWLMNEPDESPMLKFSWMTVSYKVLNVQPGEFRRVSPNINQLDVVFLCEGVPYVDIDDSDGPYDFDDWISTPIGPEKPVSHPLFVFNTTAAGAVRLKAISSAGTKNFDITLPTTGKIYVDTDLMITYRIEDGKRVNLSNCASGDYMDLWFKGSDMSYEFVKPLASNARSRLTIYLRQRAFI